MCNSLVLEIIFDVLYSLLKNLFSFYANFIVTFERYIIFREDFNMHIKQTFFSLSLNFYLFIIAFLIYTLLYAFLFY